MDERPVKPPAKLRSVVAEPPAEDSGETEVLPKPDRDAPKKPTRSPSTRTLIKKAVDGVVVVSHADKPTEDQVHSMQAGLQALADRLGAAAAATKGGGGSGPVHWLVTVVLAAASAVGVSGWTSDATLAEAIVGRMDAQDKRIDEIAAEGEEFRYAVGKLIERQIQENYHTCTRDEAEARALNWVAKRMPKGDDEDGQYEPIQVKCEQNPLLPEILTDLQTYARRVDNARK